MKTPLILVLAAATMSFADDDTPKKARVDESKRMAVERPILDSMPAPVKVVRRPDARPADADSASSKYATLGVRAIEEMMPRTPEPVVPAPARRDVDKYDLSKTGIEWHRGLEAALHKGKPILFFQLLGNLDEVYC
jgi:hypothetical protein